ncbi:hypothetical protein BGZ79_003043 [Entomortierella chlamydospora]|nr:hypothetical protein BGZ79_003043 [Entomortierella chlamydospora]
MTYTGSTIFYESVDIHSVDNHFQEDGWTVQVMISLCPHLKTIKFPLLEMNIGDIEKIGWSCDNLRELYIRIFELDTKEKIDRTIRLWLDARNKKYQIRDLGVPSQNGQSNLSLEQRVARHLLKFEKLKEVWLGTYVCRVK